MATNTIHQPMKIRHINIMNTTIPNSNKQHRKLTFDVCVSHDDINIEFEIITLNLEKYIGFNISIVHNKLKKMTNFTDLYQFAQIEDDRYEQWKKLPNVVKLTKEIGSGYMEHIESDDPFLFGDWWKDEFLESFMINVLHVPTYDYNNFIKPFIE